MANYYTSFSTVLPKPEELPQEDYLIRVKAFLSYWHDLSEKAEEDDFDNYLENYAGFQTNLVDYTLYLYEEEEGNVEAAIHFIQEYLAYFDFPSDQGVQFDYACTCSKPRPGAFYGGSVVITRDQTIHQIPEDIRKLAAAKGISLLTEF